MRAAWARPRRKSSTVSRGLFAGALSNQRGIIISAAMPVAGPKPSTSAATFTKACGAVSTTEGPKRNGRTKGISRSPISTSRMVMRGKGMFVLSVLRISSPRGV